MLCSVVLGLSEGTGDRGGFAGHWPGWYSSLSPGPASRKLLRSLKNELAIENQTSMERLSKFHLNVYPGGGDKGNWSQPMGKKIS